MITFSDRTGWANVLDPKSGFTYSFSEDIAFQEYPGTLQEAVKEYLVAHPLEGEVWNITTEEETFTTVVSGQKFVGKYTLEPGDIRIKNAIRIVDSYGRTLVQEV